MTGPGRPQGSIARASFERARATLAATPLSDPRARPAVDLAPAPVAAAPVPVRDGPGPGLGAGPLLEASRRLADGETSCRELVRSALAAVGERNDELVGLVEVLAERAWAEADVLDAELRAGSRRGPLHGIPVSVKDVIDVAGAPTRAGSDAYRDVPAVDAVAVARLRAAGAVVVGKAATHEFALGVTSPQCRNPHDPSRIPGGSSGGSAVAVATGMGLGSLGTDTRASIRVPAALSGVVGLKPTYGRVPTDGVLSLSWTMDHIAPMAATVADAAALLDALDPLGPGGDGSATWSGRAATVAWDRLRVGVPAAAFDGAEPAVAAEVEKALAALAEAGCRVEPAARPTAGDLDLAGAAGLVVSRAEAAEQHRSLGLDRSRYWPEVADQLDEADGLGALDYLRAQRLRADLAAGLGGAFAHHDVLAMPTVGVVAPPVADFAAYLVALARTAIPWSFVGFPALSVPCGSVEGLPVGLQLVAPPGGEATIVALGAAVDVLVRP